MIITLECARLSIVQFLQEHYVAMYMSGIHRINYIILGQRNIRTNTINMLPLSRKSTWDIN